MIRQLTSKSRIAVAVAVAAGVLAVGAGALQVSTAHAAGPTDTIKERQQGLKDMGAAFKTVRDQLRGGSPDAAAIKTAAATIQQTAKSIDKWFPKGTGPEAGVKTEAKPEIWSDGAGFSEAAKKLVEESDKFAQAANSGDMAAVGGGVRGLGMACKGCHDKYRVEEKK